MRTWNFGKCHGTAAFFRLCLVAIVALSLAMGGMALNTRPVQADIEIVGPCPITLHIPACVPFTYTFHWTGSNWQPGVATHWHFEWSGLPVPPFMPSDPPSWLAGLDEHTGEFTICFNELYVGQTFTTEVWVTEYHMEC